MRRRPFRRADASLMYSSRTLQTDHLRMQALLVPKLPVVSRVAQRSLSNKCGSPAQLRLQHVCHTSAAASADTGEVRPFFTSPGDGHSNGAASNGAGSEMAHKKNEDVQGPMLDPSAANKNWVKIGAASAAVLATAGASALAPVNLSAFAHQLAYGLWFGSNILVTLNGVIMFKNLPRQTFGKLQAKLFPPYFIAQAGALAVQLATVSSFPSLTVPAKVWVSLGSALAVTLANLFVIEPWTTQLMFQRYKLENAPERDNKKIGELKKKFGPLHGLSSTFNLVSLVAAAVHGFWLSSQFAFIA